MSSIVSRLLRCKPASFFRLQTVEQRPEVRGSIGQVLSKQTAPPLHRSALTHIARWCKVTAAAAALVSGGAVAMVCSRCVETVPYTDRIQLIILSTELERWLGDLAFRDAIGKYGASDLLDPLSPESVRMQGITCELVRAIRRGIVIRSLKQGKSPEEARRQTAHLNGLDWDTFVIRDERFQAFSAPGGKIVVHSRCLDVLKTEAEIASLVAHEIAHVVARHSIERCWYDNDRMRWIPSRLRQHWRQRQELEADHIGMLLVAAAGYDPRVFRKSTQEIVKLGLQKAGNTHPSPEERVQNLSQDKMEEALELYREVKAISSLCLTLKCLVTSTQLSRFPFG